MLEIYQRHPTVLRPPSDADKRVTCCAACGAPCMRDKDALVGFCDDCLEGSDPRTFFGYPEGWVMLGGGD